MNERFEFLQSNRFWVLVIGAVVLYLETKGLIGEAERTLVVTMAGGFIGIKSIDRFSEKVGKK